MKKIIAAAYVLLYVLISVFLPGCAADGNARMESVVWLSHNGCSATEEGYFFTDNESMLHFFDFRSKKTVYVCDKPECPHQPAALSEPAHFTCNAQLPGNQFAVYGEYIYYFYPIWYNKLEFRRRDIDGNNDCGLLQFRAQNVPEAFFYQDKIFIKKEIYASETFDPETGNEASLELVLSVIDLADNQETGIATFFADRGGIGAGNAFVIHDVADGKVSYYDEGLSGFYEYDIASQVAARSAKISGEKNPLRLAPFAYKEYAYGVTSSGGMHHMLKTSLITEQEEIVLSTEKRILFIDYHTDNMIVMLATDADCLKSADNELYLYNTVTGELRKLAHALINTPAFAYPNCVTDNSIFVGLAVDDVEGSIGYSGSFETVYITLDDLLAGRDTYTSVYFFYQESSGEFTTIE